MFPTSIGIEWFEDHHKYEKYLTKRCFEIEKDTQESKKTQKDF